MNKLDMKKYGFIKKYESNISDNQKVGRIIAGHNENYKVITELGIIEAEVSDNFKYEAKTLNDYPVVGDFVVVEINQPTNNSTILNKLKRKNELLRKGEWDVNYDHIVAANIDTIFICLSLNNDYNTEKLKAYISIARNSNLEPIILLTECDSFNNIDKILNEVREHTKGLDVIITSGMDSDKFKSVKNYIHEGKTIVFIGPEHDKTKMANKLLGELQFENDLILLPGGGVLINTPEMRELGIESENITKKFADIH